MYVFFMIGCALTSIAAMYMAMYIATYGREIEAWIMFAMACLIVLIMINVSVLWKGK